MEAGLGSRSGSPCSQGISQGLCCLGHPGLLCCERLICTCHRAHLYMWPLIFRLSGPGVQLRFPASVRAGVGGEVSGLPELGTILTDVLLRVGGAEAGERGPWKPIGTKFCLLKANPGAGAPGERVAAHKPRREEGPGQARQLPI